LNPFAAQDHVVIVVAAAVVFGARLTLIRELDQPYSCATGRDTTQTAFVRAQMEQDVRGELPCDDEGLPKDAPNFRPVTSELR
jgi:hypothetical protein